MTTAMINQLMPKELLPLPTELADGLRLEGVCLNWCEISPKNWFLRSKSNTFCLFSLKSLE
jgi:hypothetical protein